MTSAIDWHSAIADDFEDKYDTHPDFIERRGVWAAMIDRWMTPGARVLDVGCGAGVISRLAAAKASSVVGIDGSPEMVALANRGAEAFDPGRMRFEVARVEDAAALDGAYDLVLCSSVIEYLPDAWAVIERLAAATEPGGVLILSLPNSGSWYRAAEKLAFRTSGRPAYLAHVHSTPSPRALERGLRARGMTPLETRFYGVGVRAVSMVSRRLGLTRWNDTLFAAAFRRSTGSASTP